MHRFDKSAQIPSRKEQSPNSNQCAAAHPSEATLQSSTCLCDSKVELFRFNDQRCSKCHVRKPRLWKNSFAVVLVLQHGRRTE